MTYLGLARWVHVVPLFLLFSFSLCFCYIRIVPAYFTEYTLLLLSLDVICFSLF
jgi:hypothetical protein